MAIYVFMNIGTFAVLCAMRRQGRAVEGIEDLAGLGRTDPSMAMWMAVFMFSMAGIPPLAGFFGKLYVFLAAVQGGFWTLAVVGVLTSVVSAYYYLRIVKVMYFDAAGRQPRPAPASLTLCMAGTGLFTALFCALAGADAGGGPGRGGGAAGVNTARGRRCRWLAAGGACGAAQHLRPHRCAEPKRGRLRGCDPAPGQTAGRGRRPCWSSPPGNLYLSVLLATARPGGAAMGLAGRRGAGRSGAEIDAGARSACG